MELVPFAHILRSIRYKTDRKLYPTNEPATSWREPRLLREIAETYCTTMIIPRLVDAWSKAGIAISNRRKAIATGAEEVTVKKLNEAVEAASRNARQTGYTPTAIARIISTPSDVFMFSKLREADQRAILRQASDQEFDRYVTHAHQKIRPSMREERRGNAAVEKPAAPAATAPAPTPAVPTPASASPPR